MMLIDNSWNKKFIKINNPSNPKSNNDNNVQYIYFYRINLYNILKLDLFIVASFLKGAFGKMFSPSENYTIICYLINYVRFP